MTKQVLLSTPLMVRFYGANIHTRLCYNYHMKHQESRCHNPGFSEMCMLIFMNICVYASVYPCLCCLFMFLSTCISARLFVHVILFMLHLIAHVYKYKPVNVFVNAHFVHVCLPVVPIWITEYKWVPLPACLLFVFVHNMNIFQSLCSHPYVFRFSSLNLSVLSCLCPCLCIFSDCMLGDMWLSLSRMCVHAWVWLPVVATRDWDITKRWHHRLPFHVENPS